MTCSGSLSGQLGPWIRDHPGRESWARVASAYPRGLSDHLLAKAGHTERGGLVCVGSPEGCVRRGQGQGVPGRQPALAALPFLSSESARPRNVLGKWPSQEYSRAKGQQNKNLLNCPPTLPIRRKQPARISIADCWPPESERMHPRCFGPQPVVLCDAPEETNAKPLLPADACLLVP